MSDVGRTVLISAAAAASAFGAAVLYLDGDEPLPPPSLTRADVRAMIPPPVNVQAVIDAQPFSEGFPTAHGGTGVSRV